MRKMMTVAFLLAIGGCSFKVPPVSGTGRLMTQGNIMLRQCPVEIRLSRSMGVGDCRYLILYSTGDGGRRGLDQDLREVLTTGDYPVAGFSSKSYLKNFGRDSKTTSAVRLVRDFACIISLAEKRLGLPENTNVILVGLSRGAGLSVVAAGQGPLKLRVAGVLAIALTREEEHVVHSHWHRARANSGRTDDASAEIKTYEYLMRLSGTPVAVIQSTNDHYLSADAARILFGPDSDLHGLIAVKARNHRFRGGFVSLC
jgi:pimeloyl-ACP methyl ester carboxylesterase